MALRPTNPSPPATSGSPSRGGPANSTFIQEVDDALRADQFASFGRRYGILIGVAVIAGLIALAGWLYWQHRQNRAADAASETFVLSLDDRQAGQGAKADRALASLASGDQPTYRALARLTQANAALQANDAAKAATLLASVAADGRAPEALRDFATVRRATVLMDTARPQQTIASLAPIVARGADAPFFVQAAELTALAHDRAGDPASAAALFRTIAATQDAPDSLKSRAGQMASLLGGAGAGAAPATPPSSPKADAANKTTAKEAPNG